MLVSEHFHYSMQVNLQSIFVLNGLNYKAQTIFKVLVYKIEINA